MPETSQSPDTVPAGATADEEAATLAFARMLNPSQGTPSPDEPESDPALTPEPEAEPAEAQAEPAEPEDPEGDEPSDDVTILTIGDTEYEVPAALAKEYERGTLRQSDYTRKTTELAKAQKAADEAAEAGAKVYAARIEEYGQRIKQVDALLGDTDDEPDWDQLRASTDPLAYVTAREDWRLKQERRQAVKAELTRVQQEQAQLASEAKTKYVAAEREKLLAEVPEWKDQAVFEAELPSMVEYAKLRGFTPERLREVEEAGAILMLRDAARYRALAAKVKQIPVPTAPVKVAAKAPTPVKPTSRSKTPELTRLRQKLAKTGEGDDAAPIFLSLIQAERAQKSR